MTTATLPLGATPAEPVSTTAPAVSATEDRVSAPLAAVSATGRDRSALAMRLLTFLAIVGGAVLAGIGFAGSYATLVKLGFGYGLGGFARVFPIGVDAGIVVLLALDLHLIRRGAPWPLLRVLAHTFTVATVVFNASAGARPVSEDPLGAAVHGIIPVMFVAAVEAGRRLVIRITNLEAGHKPVGVPLYRWLLAPVPTFRLWRRMRLWDVSSYADAVAREQALRVYRVLLERQYGSVRKAPSQARLPLEMARYGLTVDEALALPQQAEEREQRRREAEEARRITEEIRAQERAAELEQARLRAAGAVEATRHQVAAATGQAEAKARAELTVVERAAQAQTEAVESAAAADAEARRAAAERAAAEDRKRAAETARAATETERAAAETQAAAVEAAAREEAANAAAEQSRRAAAEARKAAAETEQAAAETRARAAETELRAVEMEDAARLSPRERAVRKVARMILANAGGDPEQLPLEAVAETLGVAVSTASERRREAADLIASGYRP